MFAKQKIREFFNFSPILVSRWKIFSWYMTRWVTHIFQYSSVNNRSPPELVWLPEKQHIEKYRFLKQKFQGVSASPFWTTLGLNAWSHAIQLNKWIFEISSWASYLWNIMSEVFHIYFSPQLTNTRFSANRRGAGCHLHSKSTFFNRARPRHPSSQSHWIATTLKDKG